MRKYFPNLAIGDIPGAIQRARLGAQGQNIGTGRKRQLLREAHQKDKEEASRRRRLAREANEEETEEIQVRIATADIAQKATETRAIE